VHIDSIGPWNIKLNGQQMQFNALTCIDPVTNLVEIFQYPNAKTSDEARQLFENGWLARYPRPLRCVSDNGPEFSGHDFQFMLIDAGVKHVRISSHTPTANAVIESVHRTIGQVIRTFIDLHPPQDALSASRLVAKALATAMHACRCAAHSSLQGHSPGSLVFNRDMFLDIPFIADILTISELRQTKTDNRLLAANAKRIHHEFTVGEHVYILRPRTASDKLKTVYQGPYPIIQVHTNNTVTLQRGPVHERVSIRRIKPSS
jgi:hypothetical protein